MLNQKHNQTKHEYRIINRENQSVCMSVCMFVPTRLKTGITNNVLEILLLLLKKLNLITVTVS